MRIRFSALLEGLAILSGMAALWPYTFGWRSGWYTGILVTVTLLLGTVAIIRFRRVKRVFDQLEDLSSPTSEHSRTEETGNDPC